MFGEDCGSALSPEDVRRVTGAELSLASSDSAGQVGNVGGLACSWEAEGTAVRIEILPRAGLGDAQFPVDQAAYYFDDCVAEWVCSGRTETVELWLSASFQYFPGTDRAQIDAWTSDLAGVVFANAAATESRPWTRDRTGWWGDLDCEALAGVMSRELGAELTGAKGGYIDPPLPGVLLAAEASKWSNCYLQDETRALEISSSSGGAWALPSSPDDEAFETGVPGITAWIDSGFWSTTAAGYTMTDGVNMLSAYVPTDAPWSAEDAVRALARAVADWQ
ncbi:hypothetical protein J2X03_003556 [Microbacterium trichothecenolyticum]|uniref:hypothetical protein n=1 Tax=Microbacterium trichothecenolyticum TaxID=69370 RepID=UPI002854D0C3|nr:hypothetical protein [Microbacterium trichothecenolyticum]MDR7113656.1 hypothetical protein [Microbacterium trichothecenolyticum]